MNNIDVYTVIYLLLVGVIFGAFVTFIFVARWVAFKDKVNTNLRIENKHLHEKVKRLKTTISNRI